MRRFVQAFASSTALPDAWPAEVREALGAGTDRYNLGKGDEAWVLVWKEGGLTPARMRWGLVPSWSKTPETPYSTITARLERVSRSRIFSKPWRTQHCAVPMSGYYKWDRTVRPAVPHFIHEKDGRALCAAGLWECWDKERPEILSFSILTQRNEAIPSPLTPDGPIFLSATGVKLWLSKPQLLGSAALRLARAPALTSYPVSWAYRDRSRDGYTLLEPRSAEDYLTGEAGDCQNEGEDE